MIIHTKGRGRASYAFTWRFWSSWAVLALVAALGLLAVLTIAKLQSRLAASDAARVEIAQAESDLNALQELPWLTILRPGSPPEAARRQMLAVEGQLDKLQSRSDLSRAEMTKIGTPLAVNFAALEQIRVLVAQGKAAQAASSQLPLASASQVKAVLALESAGRAYAARAQQAHRQALAGAATAIALLVLAFAFLYRRLFKAITKRRQLEGELWQSQKMEAIGQLAGGVAHDFNNLLMAITGYAEFALLRADEGSEQADEIQEIQRAANRASALTAQLLAFSRQESTTTQVLYLREVIEQARKMLERIIGEDIEIVTVYPDKLMPIKIDPGQLEQVIVNLAVNARDAMPEGGALRFELDEGEADLGRGRAPCANLRVSDTGCGMDKQTQQHIFEPFYTTKEVGKGTGLGLSTVYGIVTQFGGRVGVESRVGEGTTFTICLPLTSEEMEPTPDRVSAPLAQVGSAAQRIAAP